MRVFQSSLALQTLTAAIEFDSITGSPTIDTGIYRTGLASLKASVAATTAYAVQKFSANSNTNDWYMRMYVFIQAMPSSGSPTLLQLRDTAAASAIFSLRLVSTGKLRLFDEGFGGALGSDSTVVLAVGKWYRVEFAFIRATQTVTAYINGVSFASGALAGPIPSLDTIRMGLVTSTTATVNFSDIAINDGTGSVQNGLPGEGGIFHQVPNGAGDSTGFTKAGTVTAATNWQGVDETTPNDGTDKNVSNVLNTEDDFTMTDSGIASVDTVNVVAVGVRFEGAGAGSVASFKTQLKKVSAGTVSQGSAITPANATWLTNAIATPKVFSHVTTLDPDGNPWTQSTLDSLHAGYKITTGNTRNAEISTLFASIDYSPLIHRIPTQDAVGTGTTSATAVYPATPTSGSLLIAILLDDSGATRTITGWTEALDIINVTASRDVHIFYKVAGGSEPTSISTVAAGSASFTGLSIFEYTGFVGTPTLDKTQSGTASALSVASGSSATVTSANELIIAAGVIDKANTIASWTNGFIPLGSMSLATPTTGFIADGHATALATYSTTLTTAGTSGSIGVGFATFKDVVGGGGTAYTKTLTETVTMSEVLLKADKKPFAEIVTMSEVLTALKTYLRTLTDTSTITDSITKLIGKPLAETATMSDLVAKNPTKLLTDTATMSEVISMVRTYLRTLNDTVTMSEVLSTVKTFLRTLTETVTMSEAIAKNATKPLSETVTISEAFSAVKTYLRSVSDTVTLSETYVKLSNKPFTDTATMSDTIARLPNKGLSETVTMSEVLAKNPKKALSETVTLSEVFTHVGTLLRSFADTTTISDVIAKLTQKPLAESSTISDSISTAKGKGLSDTTTITDTMTKQAQKPLSETVTMSEVFTHIGTLLRSFVETVTMSEVLQKRTNRSLVETATMTDSVTKQDQKPLADTFTLSDVLTKIGTYLRTFTDNLTLSESYSQNVVKLKNLNETVTMSESRPFFALTKSLTELVTMSEVFTHIATLLRSFTETVTMSEVFKRNPQKSFTETVTNSEVITKNTNRSLTETATITDLLAKKDSKSFAETVTLSEVFSTLAGKLLSFTETLTLTDTISRKTVKSPIESITLSEAFSKIKSGSKSFTELVTMSESFTHIATIIRTFSETITISEVFKKRIFLVFTEQITLIEKFKAIFPNWIKLEKAIAIWAKSLKTSSAWTKATKAVSIWTKKQKPV